MLNKILNVVKSDSKVKEFINLNTQNLEKT